MSSLGRALMLLAVAAASVAACKQRSSSLVAGSSPLDAGLAIDAGVDAGPGLRILFIGNSYTYVNDLPGMLATIAATSGQPPTISTDEVVQAGATLQVNWTNGIAPMRISQGGWTHVVLQGQSEEPLGEFGIADVFVTYADMFGDLVVDAGAQPVLFDTWARAAGDPLYDPWTGLFLSPAQMQDELTEAYASVAQRWPQSILACAGEAFRQTIATYPAIALQQSDLSHASVAGTYLAACTFYVALTGKPVPDQSSVPAGLSPDDAAALRTMALVGSHCADVHLQGYVNMWEAMGTPFGGDGPDGGPPFDYGIAGTPIPSLFYVQNIGEATAGLNDGMTLAPPFVWTSGAYPGGSSVPDAGVPAFCGATLDRQTTCQLSVSYTGATSATGRLTIGLTNAYRRSLSRSLKGTATSRALLTITSDPGLFSCLGSNCDGVEFFVMPGVPKVFQLFATNRGALPLTALAPGTPLGFGFGWGDGTTTNAFPGGVGIGTSAWGTNLPYCSAVALAPGQQCLLTGNVALTPDGGTPATVLDLQYSDAVGPVAPDAQIEILTSIPRPY